ncbi:MAG: hypothetical protein ABIK75_07105 [candidate division WOR-3 bacterium]
MITKLEFILFYSLFLSFIIQISSMAGATIVKNAPPPPTIPPEPTIIDYIVYPFLNLGYFFRLMSVSTDFLLLGALLFTPFLIALIYTILEFVRGTGG